MVGYLFVTLLFPLFSKMLADKTDFLPVLKLSTRLLLSFAVVISSVSLVFANDIMGLLYVQIDPQSAIVFGILMIN